MSTEEKTEMEVQSTDPAPAAEPVEQPSAEPAIEKPSAEPATTDMALDEPKPNDQKPKKEKKPRAPRKKTTPSHPPYFEMIKEAIMALDDKTGSSPYAIAKYMGENHKDELPANYKKVLATQLKNFTAKGKLVKIRASFKLKEDEAPKKSKKLMTREISKIPTKARSKRKAPTGMGAEAKKKNVRPTRVKKAKKAKKASAPKPKQPKSIKSGASKKANKAVAG